MHSGGGRGLLLVLLPSEQETAGEHGSKYARHASACVFGQVLLLLSQLSHLLRSVWLLAELDRSALACLCYCGNESKKLLKLMWAQIPVVLVPSYPGKRRGEESCTVNGGRQ
jgi:hypothetical protein